MAFPVSSEGERKRRKAVVDLIHQSHDQDKLRTLPPCLDVSDGESETDTQTDDRIPLDNSRASQVLISVE